MRGTASATDGAEGILTRIIAKLQLAFGAKRAHDNARFVPLGREAVFAGEPTAARRPYRERFTVGERSEQMNVARFAARDQHELRPVLGASRIGTHRARGEDS